MVSLEQILGFSHSKLKHDVQPYLLILSLSLFGHSCSPQQFSEKNGCTSNADCRHERVCINGECQSSVMEGDCSNYVNICHDGNVYRQDSCGNIHDIVNDCAGYEYCEDGNCLITDGKITFVSERDGNSEIYVMNTNGSDQRRLTNHAATDNFPSWSPDGSKIAFVSDRDGDDEIYVMNTDGSNLTKLTDNSDSHNPPSWSPDGSKIAFASGRGSYGEIYVMNADGSNQNNITNNSAGDFFPSWSPDGSKIAFHSLRDDSEGEIYVMNIEGSSPTRLTNNDSLDMDPSWSPDGSKIAFVSTRLCCLHTYTMNADGSNQTILSTSGPDMSPAWSPDGTKITVHSARDSNTGIYVMNADGSDQTRITNNSANDYYPNWSP